jgi:hypothetical protein
VAHEGGLGTDNGGFGRNFSGERCAPGQIPCQAAAGEAWVIDSCRTSRSRLPRQWTVPP